MFFKRLFQISILFMFTFQVGFAQSAKDTRIPYTVGDRETLLEIKLKLEAYQTAMNVKLEVYQESMNAKLDLMNEKLDAYQKSTDAKLEGINSRLSFLEALMITMIGIIIAGIAGLGTYLVWTQKRERQLAQAQTKTDDSVGITKAELDEIISKHIQEHFEKQL